MHDPSADELAAIAAAYGAVTSNADASAQPETSRWRLAGRLPDIDDQRVRFAATAASRWNAAGRLDG
ncbi:MAG: hypothetical protein M3N49_04790 [Candidatus Eremiobacteraeota bacterium]|nr:hypothetical protein [Candidatus Eremiobacteraeota bacterium]